MFRARPKAGIAVLAIAPVALTVAQEERTIDRFFLKDSDLFAVYAPSGDSSRLTRDGRRKESVTVNQNGSRIAFVVDVRRQALGTLVVLSAGGKTLSETIFRPQNRNTGAMQSIDEIEWLTRDRLVVSGAFSPVASEYVVVDAETGRELHSYFVRGFSWKPSPDGVHVAYEYYEQPRLCVDNECRSDGEGGYPQGKRRLEFQWPPVWSGDSTQVAIQAQNSDGSGRKFILVKSVDGPVDELGIPPELDESVALFWDGPQLIVRSGKLMWKLAANRSAFVRVVK